MSDTPTTAELRAILDRYTTGPTATEAAIAYLRNSPAALADLNGGEWVQPTIEGINTYRPWVNPLDGGTHWVPVDDDPPPGWFPLCYFVPREDR